MKNLAFQTIYVNEAITNVNSVSKTSKITNTEVDIKELTEKRTNKGINDGAFYVVLVGDKKNQI